MTSFSWLFQNGERFGYEIKHRTMIMIKSQEQKGKKENNNV